jgi:tetratricopeptide (TPR) repeat protein
VAGIVIALVVTAALYGRAESARRDAEARFNDTRSMANYMLFDLYDTLTPVPGTVAARERIAAESQAHLNRLATARAAPTDVQFDVARGLMRLAEVQGLAGFANLGQTRPAVENLRRADMILTRLHGLWPAREDIRLALATVRLKRSIINLYGDHDALRALTLVRAAEALTFKAGASRLDPASALLAWEERIHEGDCLTWLFRTKESLALLETELARHESLVATVAPNLQVALLQLDTLRFLGEAEFYAHDFAAAAKALRRGLALADRMLSDHPNDPRIIIRITTIAQTLGDSLADSNHIPEAVTVLRSGRAAAARLSEMDSGDLSSRRRVLSYDADIAAGLSALGRQSEAEGVIAEAHRAYLALLKTYPNDANLFRAYARSIRSRGEIKEREGQHAEACAWFQMAQATWTEFDRRWGISPSDRSDSLASLDEDLQKCRGPTAGSRSAPSP